MSELMNDNLNPEENTSSEQNTNAAETPSVGSANENPGAGSTTYSAPYTASASYPSSGSQNASASQQPQQSTYHYGQYSPNPVPQATQSGYYTYQPSGQQNPQNGYSPYSSASQQGYQQPNYNTAGGYYTNPNSSAYQQPIYRQPEAPKKKEKKPHKGLKTVLTIGITAVATAAMLLMVLWGVGVFSTRQMPVDSAASTTESSEQTSSQDSSASKQEAESAPDAFAIQSTPSANEDSSTTTSGTLSPKQVAAKVQPSVVCIENFSDASAATTALQSEGSGIIFTSDGYIITNAHVVSSAAALKVVLYDGTTYDAYLVGSDTTTDLAVIRVDGVTDLTAAEFGDSSTLAQGDYVMAIGNPGGLAFSNSVTYGIVSATNRTVTDENGYSMSCIQTDAAINPGNSGGPLVNMYGQVVGINSSKIVATGYEGLGFAISINEAQSVISDLKEFGYVKDRPYLGITYQFVDESISRVYGMPVGIYVYSFTTDVLSSTGVKIGDILTQVNGQDITTSSVLINLLAEKAPGDTLDFTVYRASDRSTFNVTVTLGEYTPEIAANAQRS